MYICEGLASHLFVAPPSRASVILSHKCTPITREVYPQDMPFHDETSRLKDRGSSASTCAFVAGNAGSVKQGHSASVPLRFLPLVGCPSGLDRDSTVGCQERLPKRPRITVTSIPFMISGKAEQFYREVLGTLRHTPPPNAETSMSQHRSAKSYYSRVIPYPKMPASSCLSQATNI